MPDLIIPSLAAPLPHDHGPAIVPEALLPCRWIPQGLDLMTTKSYAATLIWSMISDSMLESQYLFITFAHGHASLVGIGEQSKMQTEYELGGRTRSA